MPRVKLGIVALGAVAVACSASGRQAPEAAPGLVCAIPFPIDAQGAVDELLKNHALPVAVVVLETDTGRPLALGRHRGADPATLALRPGSTVKPLLAWVAADAGELVPNQTHTCNGEYAGEFRCFAAHGVLTLPNALATSCNVYGFELSSRLGLARITDGFRGFGFGKPTALAAPESAGFVADPAWVSSRAQKGEEHFELAVGIGHGPIEVTPLQLAVAYAKLLTLLATPSVRVPVELKAEIMEGLRLTVEGGNGTARAAAVEGLRIVGRTGTAEGGAFGTAPPESENAWFVGFAPREAPRFVVSVLVVGGENGGKTAAPLAASIFERLMASPS